MALEEANTIYVPFVGEFEVDSLKGAALLVGGLAAGQTVKHMTDDMGEGVADKGMTFISNFVGDNPVTGQSSQGQVV